MANILVIDDDHQFLEMVRLMLEAEGYSVVCASDGAQGLKRSKETVFDLVVCDVIMPNKEGVETVMEMSTVFPSLKVIVVSGGGRYDSRPYLSYLKHMPNVAASFSKPFEKEAFLESVKKCLE